MDENRLKTETRSAETRKRKKRRSNLFLYIAALLLVLLGVFIILRDSTFLFTQNTGVRPDVTFPPLIIHTTNTPVPTDPGPTEGIVSDAPEPSQDPDATPDPNSTPVPTAVPTQAPTPVPTEEAPSPPVNVYFEGHDIAVKVVPVGVNEKGEMDSIPTHDIAGWYKYGSAPNQPGNCIIAGHNRYAGQIGLFAILHKGLKVGDFVIVTMENGSHAFYEVVSITKYKYDAVPDSVMELGGETRLTLITCLGDYSWILHMSKTRVVAVCRPITTQP